MKHFETERLVIRQFTAEDYQDLYEYLSDEEAVKYEPYEVYTLDACKEEAACRSKNGSFLAVILKETNKLIGNLYFQKRHFETWELGYVFNTKYQKKGYATEAIRGLLQHEFIENHVRRVIALCNPENSNSWRLLERVGMKREGHLRKNVYFKVDEDNQPIWQDTYEYGILESDYTALYSIDCKNYK